MCVCTHAQTMTKTISLSDTAYDALAALKRPGESFSDVALRLSAKARQRDISRFAGIIEMNDAEAKRRIGDIRRARDAGREA